MVARILAIAGSDSGGGAGIQADIKTISALGGYAMTAVTAITAQNTLTVSQVHAVPPDIVTAQIRAVIDDIGIDAIKTGMLATPDLVDAVADALISVSVPLVVDPVMVATAGASLSSGPAVQRLVARLFPRAWLVTPNLPEAAALTGFDIRTRDDMERAARAIMAMGPKAVLVKGGHLDGPMIADLFWSAAGAMWWEDTKIETKNTHGTGCTLASAIATGLGQGLTMETAIARARRYVRRAILSAPGLGAGHGPLNHSVAPGD